jgi:hypothetical protein
VKYECAKKKSCPNTKKNRTTYGVYANKITFTFFAGKNNIHLQINGYVHKQINLGEYLQKKKSTWERVPEHVSMDR